MPAAEQKKAGVCAEVLGPHVFGRHQPGIVAQELQLAAEMMCADAGLHADQARRQVGKSRLDLATRPFLPQYDDTALILANDVERVLADIDADYGGRIVELL